jgi:hypothetical protein
MECATAARVVHSNPSIPFNCGCKQSPGFVIIAPTNCILSETLYYIPGMPRLAEKQLC